MVAHASLQKYPYSCIKTHNTGHFPGENRERIPDGNEKEEKNSL